MRRLLALFYLMVGGAFAGDNRDGLSELADRLKSELHAYTVKIAYKPIFMHGASLPEGVYNDAAIEVSVSAILFGGPVGELITLTSKQQLKPVKPGGRWAAGVKVFRRETSAPVFSIELSIPTGAVAVNGRQYASTPEIVAWFNRFLLPAVRPLNHGYNKIDEL